MYVQDNKMENVKCVVTHKGNSVCVDEALSVVRMDLYLNMCVQQLELLKMSEEDEDLRNLQYKTSVELMTKVVEKIDCYVDSQSKIPMFVMEQKLDVKKYCAHLDRMMEELDAGLDVQFMTVESEIEKGEVYSVGALLCNLRVLKGRMIKLLQRMIVMDDEMLKKIYDLVNTQMNTRYQLKSMVETEIDARCTLEGGAKLSSNKVKELQSDLFKELYGDQKEGRLEFVLSVPYESIEKREVEIGRVIFSEYCSCGDDELKWNERLRLIMVCVYGYDYCKEKCAKPEGSMSKGGEIKELAYVYEIVNRILPKYRGKGVDESTIEKIWRGALSDIKIRKWLLKRGTENYKGIGLRPFGMLLGRCLMHHVYKDINESDMAGFLYDECGCQKGTLRNYIWHGKNDNNRVVEVLAMVDDIIEDAMK